MDTEARRTSITRTLLPVPHSRGWRLLLKMETSVHSHQLTFVAASTLAISPPANMCHAVYILDVVGSLGTS